MSDAGQASLNSTHAFIARFLAIHETQSASARAELERLRTLIADAGERLLASFDVISAAPALAPETVEALGKAVSALQFQDMANQLVGHATQRIELLERIAAPLARVPEVSVEELSDAVAGSVASRDDGPVAQACMSGGSIDLF